MLYGRAAWIDDLLDALAARLAGLPGLTVDRVFESLADDTAHAEAPPAERFLVVRPVSLPVIPPAVAGGGRLNTAFDARVRVATFARLAHDREFRDRQALRDRTRSVTRFVRDLISRLQLWTPTRDGPEPTGLLTEPMRLVSADFVPRPVRGGGGAAWVVVPTLWQMKFRDDLGELPA